MKKDILLKGLIAGGLASAAIPFLKKKYNSSTNELESEEDKKRRKKKMLLEGLGTGMLIGGLAGYSAGSRNIYNSILKNLKKQQSGDFTLNIQNIKDSIPHTKVVGEGDNMKLKRTLTSKLVPLSIASLGLGMLLGKNKILNLLDKKNNI